MREHVKGFYQLMKSQSTNQNENPRGATLGFSTFEYNNEL